MPHTLEVFLGSRIVGTITNLSDDHNVFVFDSEYAADEDRATLSLGFYDADRKLSAPTRAPQVRLLPFFSNLLPEGHLRQYLADRAHVNHVRDFPLLWLLGEDLPGAAIVRHRDGIGAPRESKPIVSQAVEDDPSILKFSLAGVQLKFSAIMEADGGLTIPTHGKNGQWILKMPSAIYAGVPENEFAMMTFARAVGIEVPDFSLVDPTSVHNMPSEIRSDLGRALSVKRFDRDGMRRIHIEDFNQIYNQYPRDKYKNASYGNMLRDIWRTMGEEQTREFVRRFVFNIGIGNADMHLKNWSVVYADGKTPRLAPAYDYLSTIVYIEDDALALTIAGTRRWGDISYDHLERFARRSAVPRGVVLDSAKEMATRMHDVWPSLQRALDVPKRTLTQIDNHMRSVPIFSGRAGAEGAAPTEDDAPREIQ